MRFSPGVNTVTIPFLAILILTCIALITDIKSRIVPNWLVGIGFLTGLVYQLFFGSIWQGLGAMLLAFAIGFPLFLLRGLGAGDVKLLMAVGLWTNMVFFLNALFWIAVIGGALTVLAILFHRRGKSVYLNLKYFFYHLLIFWKPPKQLAMKSVTLPYCIPIFLGTAYAVAAHLLGFEYPIDPQTL